MIAGAALLAEEHQRAAREKSGRKVKSPKAHTPEER